MCLVSFASAAKDTANTEIKGLGLLNIAPKSGLSVTVENNTGLPVTIVLYDMTGKQLRNIPYYGGTVTIDPSEFPDGVYVVAAITSDKMSAQKVVFKGSGSIPAMVTLIL